MSKYTRLIPGVAVVACVQYVAGRLTGFIPLLDGLTLGILLGILINNLIPLPESLRPGIKFTEKQVLKWGIVLLGIELNFALIWQLGGKILALVVLTVIFGLTMSWMLAKLLRVNTKLSTLIGVGSSICGASAIAAVEPIVGPEKEDVAISAATISLLGAAGVLAYPLIGAALRMAELPYGVWAGSSLQGVAHAVAAAMAYGDVSGEIGTLVKMGRVVLLAPVALVLTWIFSRGTGKQAKNVFPLYVLGFIAVGVLATLGVLPRHISLGLFSLDLKLVSKLMITAAMVAMGLGVNLKSLGHKGLKAMLLGAVLFLSISVVTFTVIGALGI